MTLPLRPLSSADHCDLPFLQGGGEMGERTRHFDWSQTPLGTPNQWQPSLRTSVSILLNSQFPMFVWWGKELTTIYNDSYKIIAGDKHPALLGKSGREAWAEIWDDLAPLVEKVFNGASTWSEDLLLYINRRGFVEETYFTFSYSPILDESGAVGGLFCAVVETTEKVVSRKKVEKSEQNLRNTILQAPVAMCILRGSDAVIEIVNELMAELLGKPTAGLIGHSLFTAIPEVKDRGLQALLHQVRTTGETYKAYAAPFTLPRESGPENVYVDFVYEPYREENGSISGVIVVAINVTEQVSARKKIEESQLAAQLLAQELAASNEELRAANEEIQASNEELAVSNAQLVRSNTDLDNFIYTASHDLKAPIHNIEGLMKVLIRSLPPESMQSERIASTAHLIAQSVERFKRTIFHLTEVSKLQKEANQPSMLVPLANVLEEVLLDLAPLIEASSARVEVDVRECRAIEFSEKNLRSILYNLLSNAIKYRSLDRLPIVKVSCRAQPDYHLLTVEDNGLGMDLTADKQEKLFAMFRRFHTHVEGSGIGLYMVKKIVDNAGGKIEVESKLGIGSMFKVYFRK